MDEIAGRRAGEVATNAEPATTTAVATLEPELSLTVQQTAERSGLSEHTLRYYERAGLLDPVRRHDSSRHRRYSAADLARIQTLACLRATGMPLDQMRRYFELASQGAAGAPELIALLENQQIALQERVEQMQRHHLRETQDRVLACGRSPRRPGRGHRQKARRTDPGRSTVLARSPIG
jgi:DNA-binding transcriptional MerR regulator